MKIVINVCFGGFSLSDKAVLRLAELKGITVYPKKDSLGTSYYTVPPEQRLPETTSEEWQAMTTDERIEYNHKSNAQYFANRPEERDDPHLVQVVEELGAAANGSCAQLAVVEIPDGVEWEIDEYDGNETIDEVHRSWR